MSAVMWDNPVVRERPSEAMFAGRKAELDVLCDALDALGTSGARTVLVGGEAAEIGQRAGLNPPTSLLFAGSHQAGF